MTEASLWGSGASEEEGGAGGQAVIDGKPSGHFDRGRCHQNHPSRCLCIDRVSGGEMAVGLVGLSRRGDDRSGECGACFAGRARGTHW